MGLVLASGSKRRKELLEQIGLKFDVMIPQVNEEVDLKRPEVSLKHLAKRKAMDVMERRGLKSGLVIAADTIGLIDGNIIGKPKDRPDARNILKRLSGRTHIVLTGVCVIDARTKRAKTFVERTKVTFFRLSEREIEWYLDSGEWKDKAGAYGIQGLGAALVRYIKGDYFNVVGLPMAKVWRVIRASSKNV